VIKLRTSLLATILPLVLVGGLPLTSQAQESQAQTIQTDTLQAPPPPVAIPASDVVTRAAATNARLREVRSDAAVDPEIGALAERVPEILAARNELIADSASQNFTGLSRRALQALRERWERYREQLESWQASLTERLQKLGTDQDSLARVRAIWETTAEAADREGYPDVAVQTIGDVRTAIAEVQAATSERVDSVLTLQNQLVELSSEAAEVLARIEAAEGEARVGLLRPDQPPLWTAIASEPAGLSSAHVAENTRQDLDTIAGFLEESADTFIIQFVILLILFILMLLLSRRAKESKIDDPEIENTVGLFTRPFSATILIFLLTMRLFHPRVPLALIDSYRLLALIPLLRLLPMLLKPTLRRPVYVFAALWLLHDASNLLPEGSVAQRLGVLGVATLSLAAFIWILRKVEQVTTTEAWQDLARHLARLGAAVLAAAIVANVLGFVDLAELLTNGILLSVLFAGAVYAGGAVIQLFFWLALRAGPAQSIASIKFNTNLLTRRVKSAVRFMAIAGWIAGTLNGFDLLRPTYDVSASVLTTPLVVGSLSISLGDIVAFLLAIWTATLAARFTRFILEQDVFPHLTLPRGVPGAITKVSTYIIIGLGLVIAVAAAGIDLSNIALLAGALGVGIGFGLQTIVSNFVSGLILIFERPIQVGDSIQLDTLKGTVKNIGIRASTVRTFDGAEVLVPNADLIAGRVVNWTLSDRLRRLDIPVGVAYGSDPRKTKEILLQVAKGSPDCLQNPEPYVLFQGFGDSSLDFELRFWTSNFDNWLTIKSDATFDVHDALREAGIEIPFPQRDLHVKSVDSSITGDAVTDVIRPERHKTPQRPDTEAATD